MSGNISRVPLLASAAAISSWFTLPAQGVHTLDLLSRSSATVMPSCAVLDTGVESSSITRTGREDEEYDGGLVHAGDNRKLDKLKEDPLLKLISSRSRSILLNSLSSSSSPSFTSFLQSQIGHEEDLSHIFHPSCSTLLPPPLRRPFLRSLELLSRHSFSSSTAASSMPSTPPSLPGLSSLENDSLWVVAGAGHVTHPFHYLNLFSEDQASWLRFISDQDTMHWLEIWVNSQSPLSLNCGKDDSEGSRPTDPNSTTSLHYAIPVSSPLAHDVISGPAEPRPSPILHATRDLVCSALLSPAADFMLDLIVNELTAGRKEQFRNSSPWLCDEFASVHRSFREGKGVLPYTRGKGKETDLIAHREDGEEVLVSGIEVKSAGLEQEEVSLRSEAGPISFTLGDQSFAKTKELVVMGMCGGPITNSQGQCLGVLEGVVPVEEDAELHATSTRLDLENSTKSMKDSLMRILSGKAAFVHADEVTSLGRRLLNPW